MNASTDTVNNANGVAPANNVEASGQQPAAVKKPLSALYKDLVLLDRRFHTGKRVKPVSDWSIARGMNAVFASVVEFYDIAREYPIAFIVVGKTDQGRALVSPVALLGLRDLENAYVTPDGQWNARYIPAFLRRYPFAFVQTEDNQLGVGIDAAWSGLNDTDGELLIDEKGESTPFLQQVLKFLDHFEQDVHRTRILCDKLVELNLLRAGEIGGQLPNGEAVKATGLFLIDEQKLRELPDATVLELHRNGMLGLINAHLLSVGQVSQLAQRMLPAQQAAQQQAPQA
jgi:hypothetical protein